MPSKGKRRVTDNPDSDSAETDWKAKVDTLQQQLQLLQTQLSASSSLEQVITAASQAKLPPIPLVEPKLDGKLTYRAWRTNIEAVAQSIDHIWDIIIGQDDSAASRQQQYARSLLVLNVVPELQLEITKQDSAEEIWKHFREQYGTIDFSDVTTSIRRLRTLSWHDELKIEKFYREFKAAQATIQEVTGQPFSDQVLISHLLCAVDKQFPEFVSMVESQLSRRTTPASEKTFESVFGQFRTQHYRREARLKEEEDTDKVINKVTTTPCSICEGAHRTADCYIAHPDRAPPYLQARYRKRHEEWKKAKQDKDAETKTPAIE